MVHEAIVLGTTVREGAGGELPRTVVVMATLRHMGVVVRRWRLAVRRMVVLSRPVDVAAMGRAGRSGASHVTCT